MTLPTAQRLFDVSDAICVITGGASGIGLAYAEVMLANHAKVHIIDQDQVAIDTALDSCGCPELLSGHCADVTNPQQLRSAIEAVARTDGRIDIAFVNAGIGGDAGFLSADGQRTAGGCFEDLPLEEWIRVMDVNVHAAVRTMQEVARVMKARAGGRIVVTSSVSASRADPHVGTPYVVSKSAVAHLVRQAALELARYGITVNAIAPGLFKTNVFGTRRHDDDWRARLEPLVPMHRLGTGADIQGAALFLASPAARYVTGAHITVDGGYSLGTAD